MTSDELWANMKTHEFESEPIENVPDFNYPMWTCKKCGATWNKLIGTSDSAHEPCPGEETP